MRFLKLTTILCALAGPAFASPFEKELSLQGVTFHVKSANEGSKSPFVISVKGLKGGDKVVTAEADGIVTGAEVADLNANGFPEIYVFTQSAGSGSYGNVIAYSSNRNRSVSEIFLAEMSKKDANGYMGHDEFAVVEQYLVRRFPVYLAGDTNAKATGGTRQVQYRLVNGEASWLLRAVRTMHLN